MLSDYYPEVFPAAQFSLDRLRWARALLDSREVLVRRHGVLTSCLVPLVDMLNHAPTAHCWHRWFDDAREMLCVELNAPAAAAGQQLYLSYGPLRTWQLLQYYGFVPEANPFDAIDVRLGDPAALTPAQKQVCASHGLTADHAIRAGPVAPSCMAYLRVAVATAAELKRLGGADPRLGPLSDRNERAAREALRNVLTVLRDQWRPAVTDNELVRAGAAEAGPAGLGTRILVVRYRRTQLQLLQAALDA